MTRVLESEGTLETIYDVAQGLWQPGVGHWRSPNRSLLNPFTRYFTGKPSVLNREKWKCSVKAEVSLRPLTGSWEQNFKIIDTLQPLILTHHSRQPETVERSEPESQPDLRFKSSSATSLRCLSLTQTLASQINPVFLHPSTPWGGCMRLCLYAFLWRTLSWETSVSGKKS